MKIIQGTKRGIKTVLLQGFSLIYTISDKRVPLYIKLMLLIPVGYIISPVDLIPDSVFIIGHLDDLFVLGISYYLLKKGIKPEIIAENIEKANDFLLKRGEQKFRFLIMVSIIWIAVITFLAVYLMRKIYLTKHN